MSSDVEVASERQGNACWIFQIRGVGPASMELTLSWADYDWWSPTGCHPPSEVALAVLRVLMSAPSDIAREYVATMRIDASSVRRRIPDADRLVVDGLQRSG